MAYRSKRVYVLNTTSPVTVACPPFEQALSSLLVYLNGVLKSLSADYTYDSLTNQITYSGTHAVGNILSVVRSSDLDNREVDYQDAVDLTEVDLDTDSKQAFYLLQELKDELDDSLKVDPSLNLNYNAGGKQIKNVANGSDAQDAVTKAQLDANSTADRAYADAQDDAHSTADRAYADAQDDAHSTADRAYADAQDDAHSTADKAYVDNTLATLTTPINVGSSRFFASVGTAGQTVVTAPVNFDRALVFIERLQQFETTDYTYTSPNKITLNSALSGGEKILLVLGDLAISIADADTLAGYLPSDFALATHNHTGVYAPVSHTHTQAQSHGSPDTDTATTALHHTLGTGANQAAAGNHNHTGTYAPASHSHTQSESHGSPDTDTATTALHHTLGTGANQAAAGNHNHTGTYAPASHSHTQSESHGSPDTDTAPTALHHTLGTGANQAAAGNHTHSSGSLSKQNSAVPASASTISISVDGIYCIVLSCTGTGTPTIFKNGSSFYTCVDAPSTTVAFLSLSDGDEVAYVAGGTTVTSCKITGPFKVGS